MGCHVISGLSVSYQIIPKACWCLQQRPEQPDLNGCLVKHTCFHGTRFGSSNWNNHFVDVFKVPGYIEIFWFSTPSSCTSTAGSINSRPETNGRQVVFQPWPVGSVWRSPTTFEFGSRKLTIPTRFARCLLFKKIHPSFCRICGSFTSVF